MNPFRRNKPPALYVATPTRGAPWSGFVQSRDRLVNWAYVAKRRGRLRDFWRGFEESSDIAMNRCGLVLAARARGATHLLFIDDDMEFPEDTAARLLAHGKAVVGCNYPTRKTPLRFTAGALEQDPRAGDPGVEYRYVDSGPGAGGLEAAAFVGLGCCLIDMRVFDAIDHMAGRVAAWFVMPREDVIFCALARRAGFEVWVDHALSREIGHRGEFTFRCQHVGVEVFGADSSLK